MILQDLEAFHYGGEINSIHLLRERDCPVIDQERGVLTMLLWEGDL